VELIAIKEKIAILYSSVHDFLAGGFGEIELDVKGDANILVDNSGLIREREKYREMIRREKIEGVYTGRQKKEKII